MATFTPNHNLGKPEPTDPFGYSSFLPLFNDNMDKIDQIGGGGGGGDLTAHELTQAEYNALSQAEKESETDVYFINDTVKEEIETPVDVTNWVLKNESSMAVSTSSGFLVFQWGGGANIGAQATYSVAIPADVTKIKFKLTTGSSYSNSIPRFRIGIGVKTSYLPNTFAFPDTDYDNNWIKFLAYDQRNTVIEDELDLSDVNSACYLYFIGHGWNVTVNEMVLVTEQETSETVRKIMYKDVPYADADTSYFTVVDGELNIIFDDGN